MTGAQIARDRPRPVLGRARQALGEFGGRITFVAAPAAENLREAGAAASCCRSTRSCAT
jgi:hypothetical protein